MSLHINVFSRPFQSETLSDFPHLFQIEIVVACLKNFQDSFTDTAPLHEFIKDHNLSNAPVIKGHLAEEFLLQGEFEKALEVIGETRGLSQLNVLGTIQFLKGDYSGALSIFEEGIAEYRSSTGIKNAFGSYWQMLLYGLALNAVNESKFDPFVKRYSNYVSKNALEPSAAAALNAVNSYLKNNDDSAFEYLAKIDGESLFGHLLQVLTASVVGVDSETLIRRERIELVTKLGYDWISYETENISDSETEIALNFSEFEGIGYVCDALPKTEDWERALNTLRLVAKKAAPKKQKNKDTAEKRLAWLIDFENHEIQPIEQKQTKKGWSKGRNIALSRLFEGTYEHLQEIDKPTIEKALKKQRDYYSSNGYVYHFSWGEALKNLVEHPLLFSMRNRDLPLSLAKAEPTLEIKEQDGFLELSFDCEFESTGTIVERETELRYKVIEVLQQHVEVANSLRDNRLRVPVEGRDLLLQAVRPLSETIAIQSDLEEHFEELPSVEVDKRIYALLTQRGEGFILEFFVKPFGSEPPYFKPGQGPESVVTELDGVKTRTRRDLKAERKLLNEVESACPSLAATESDNYEWYLEDAIACLTALTEIEIPKGENLVVIEWVKGQKLNLVGSIDSSNFRLAVNSRKDWFHVDGEVRVSEELVFSMREIRQFLGSSKGNFIELSDGEFVAMTDSLRRHIDALDTVLTDDNELHSLRVGILEDFADELEHFETDRAWKEKLKQIQEARSFVPTLPSTFDAELRPYQMDGFIWLSRLARWGVGACLADDMGLGKTLQTLSILVERAEKGPAIVAAPVSVCRNWLQEGMRFAPTLRMQMFGPGDRAKVVEDLGPYDVLVTSYNLLQSEEESITNKKFATAVLDEAQAIKNRNTKRSKAVMKLDADFRMVTTGTPIENHLGELWNLFNFINPGLLGSPNEFSEKFAVPIERDKDVDARSTLQRLVKPFILRRRKNQVLDDLPEKTEIVLNVEMSEAEQAFYESIRRDALEKINESGGTSNENRFRILAELTKLRLASCHPKLVDPNIPIPSSKLGLFGQTITELLDNNHKALVFSQFVKHLQIAEDFLKEEGVSYQYLDGSTPPGKRQERIDAFQRGEGDVFLISLKAGGTGLNLTAADYVIHLDPWWNPAVEDQATDRVHRIGQQRPVTVYRFVTENSVEEKILALHKTKRDLADSLLDGTETSGKLSADDLLALITEN